MVFDSKVEFVGFGQRIKQLKPNNNHDLDGVYIDPKTKKIYLIDGLEYRELIPCQRIKA